MKRAASILTLALFCCLAAKAQVHGTPPARTVPSLSEPNESLVVRDVSPRSGHVTFAGAEGRGILLPLEASATAEARALRFIDLYGRAFGLASSAEVQLQRQPQLDHAGVEHVRLQQVHQGVPVRGGEFLVHLEGPRVIVANGQVTDDLPANVTPSVHPEAARAVAQQLIEKRRPGQAPNANYSEARLEILNRGLLSDSSDLPSKLAWFIEATGPLLREFIWIDAQTGVVLLNFAQIDEAKSRSVYNANHTYNIPGTLIMNEGGSTADADALNAYNFAGITYDYYLTNHGRDSYNGAGATIVSSVHYCEQGYPQGSTCPTYQNAAWTGTQMVYADGFADADDVVGHELTHAVTEYSANLFYYMQSGALNESFSDIFGETIDLTDAVGNDAAGVRWKLGEDLSVGAIRDMMTPTLYGDPGKMSDSGVFYCSGGDGGGVHINSGIPNHAYALMVDGGTYNNTTITGIGLTKAAKIEYRALTTYLLSGSNFIDDYNALNQSCSDLVGTAGISAADCTQVRNALLAVEMNNRWGCSGATQAPPLCATGTPVNTFSDGFESVTSNWTITNGSGLWSDFITDYSKDGTHSAYGTDPQTTSDHRLTQANAVVIPAGGRLYFDHAFAFELGAYDGGVLEYSTTNGSSWADAGSLMEAGQKYNGTIDNGFGNPVGGRSGFVDYSFGYTGTRLNLASLAGQSVKFRFRIGSDSSFGGPLGWVVDNFRIYTCASVATGTFPVIDTVSKLGTVNVATESSTVTGNAGFVLTDIAVTSSGTMYGISSTSLYTVNPATGAASLVGSLGVSGMNALVAYGNTLYGGSGSSASLYLINKTTGAATALSGSLGFPTAGDLAYHSGMLYATVLNGAFSDLVRVTVTGSTFTATNLGHITNETTLMGLAEGSDHNLYAVGSTKVLRIDTTNPGSSVVVVPNYALTSTLGSANGAASNAVPFTDDPATSAVTLIKALHITELRTRIAAVRAARGLSVYTYATDPVLPATTTRLKAAHIIQLRDAITQVYTALGSTPPTFTDPDGTLPGLGVKAIHIAELRAAVMAME